MSGTQRYFERVPDRWDALYSHENLPKYLLNRTLRRGLYERHRFAFEQAGDLTGASVLDLGCGSGRYSIESAKRGARRVVGIDFAPSMLSFAEEVAAREGVADRCEFIRGDVVADVPDEHFDVVLALGLFDYIRDPAPLFQRVARAQPRAFVASFPKFTPVWGTQRLVRYYLIRRCPIYNYKRAQVAALCRDAGFAHSVVTEGKRGLLCAAGFAAPSGGAA